MTSLRRRFRQTGTDDAEVNMTPMLDIVFIMLIFFIVTAVFIDETAMDFTQAPPSTSPPSLQPTISVYIDDKNIISVERQVAELSAVGSRVEVALAEKPDAAILLTASAQASWDPVVSIKDQMMEAGRPVVIEVTR